VCEVKRLYVRPQARGQGVGRALMQALVGEAAKAGYGVIRLETLETMSRAQTLYRSLGFEHIAPYHASHTDHDRSVFMELVLRH
jgi:ribosomal protein S18 acetylase RimI-like enzyme